MPNGKAHAFATLTAALATPFIVQGLGMGANPTNTIAATAGCLLGLVVTPDLDVNHGCRSMQIIQRRAGKPAAEFWRAMWMPYALLVPHRSWLSHFPLAGTTLRLGYVYIIFFCFAILAAAAGFTPMPEIHLNSALLKNSNAVWAFFGLALSDTLHYAMDKVFRNS